MASTEDDVVVRLKLKDVARFVADVKSGKLAIDDLEKKIGKAGRTAARESSERGGGFGALSGVMRGLAHWGGRGALALGAAGVATAAFAVKSAASLEQTTMAFETMLGSAGKAKKMVSDLQTFARVTPFAFPGVTDASQKLLAFGWTARSIIPTLTAVGDAAAGLNLGQEGMSRLSVILGQIQSKGKLQGDEVLQLAEAGINARAYLMKGLGMTPDQLSKTMQQGNINAAKALPIIIKGMGDQFKGLMDKQSHTLGGIWSNFMDAAQQGLVKMVNPYLPAMKRWLQQVVDNMPAIQATVARIVRATVDKVKVGVALARKLFDWGSGVYDQAKTAVDGYIAVVANALSNGDWTPVGAVLAKAMRNTLMTALGGAGGANGGIDWLALGKGFVPALGSFLVGFLSALLDPVVWWNFLKDNWKPLLWIVVNILILVFTGGIGGAVGKLGEILLKLPFLKWAGSLLVWIQRGITWARPYLMKAMGAVGRWIWGGFERVFPEVAARLSFLWFRIVYFFKITVPGLAKAAGGWATGFLGAIGRAIAEAPFRLVKAIGKFGAWLVRQVGALSTRFGEAITGAITAAFGTAFAWIAQQWDNIKGMFGGALGWLFGTRGPETAPTPAPVGPTIQNGIGGIPGRAAGGTVTGAGWSVVGENGPELRHMARGASVIPLPRVPEFAGGSREIHTHVYVDKREIAHAVHSYVDDKVARR